MPARILPVHAPPVGSQSSVWRCRLRVLVDTRPHRINLERALAAADVPWTVAVAVAVEAEGRPLRVHFAAPGVGLAVVTGGVR